MSIVKKNYIRLDELGIYKESLEISRLAWGIYIKLSWQVRKIVGDQFIRAIDSVGANIAEGYGRFHYLDRIKFYYNSRGSLLESSHWVNLLLKRKLADEQSCLSLINLLDSLNKNLNVYIKTVYRSKFDG
ncbi:four helix bundle protein [Patescibacteria group bacterium]|nr:four helix bundle protein [Patescibacteria group bacterium]